jgi:oligoribonuclease
VTVKHQFLWIDLETSGLDPHSCIILEWAAVLAADNRYGDMSPVEQYASPIHFDYSTPPKMDEFVRKMHTDNGLLSACIASTFTLAESEDFLIELVGGPETRGVVLAGGSVHFDLGFIRVHMPAFAKCLSHRVLDVSTFKAAERTWEAADAFPDIKGTNHRALDDVLASLAEAKRWRERRYPR